MRANDIFWESIGTKEIKMPSNDFLPREDSQLQNWLNNFYTTCEKNDTILNLDAEDITELASEVSDFDTGMTNVESTKAAAKSAVNGKNGAKTTVTATVRAYARRFKSNPAIPESLLTELGILSNSGSGPVVTVNGLTVIGCDDGVNKLKWNRNGNASGTLFIIEYRRQGQTSWGIAGAVTRSDFNHINQEPGQTTYYRIVSSRGGQSSLPTAPVVVYGNPAGNGLSIAA